MLADAWTYLLAHPAQFRSALAVHVALSAAALGIAAAIAIPAGIAAARRPVFALAAVSTANIGRTLPSLAVLALAMPLLGTGFAPSLFALTLLALPPILINTVAGMRSVDPDVVDAARGMGIREQFPAAPCLAARPRGQVRNSGMSGRDPHMQNDAGSKGNCRGWWPASSVIVRTPVEYS